MWTDVGYRSIRNFEKRVKLWRKHIEEDHNSLRRTMYQYTKIHGPVKLENNDFSEPAHAYAYISDGPVNHQYDFDTLITDGDELKFHLVAKDGYVTDEWLSEKDLSREVVEKLFSQAVFPLPEPFER